MLADGTSTHDKHSFLDFFVGRSPTAQPGPAKFSDFRSDRVMSDGEWPRSDDQSGVVSLDGPTVAIWLIASWRASSSMHLCKGWPGRFWR
jgi:hypothetical protein